ncbi:hypothetical protein E0H77_12590 [Acinetobacter sp. ANC 4633]|uniref:hypothetical protein n=1 Tax=Acinetobacter sp. ANC 4633 TaxID=2529845 RepID=UPI00103C32A0|nr:hypothetical protein [Acinetobacter sp. ANC 4633]TCB23948.1 hypothetical protein E0H77_12590 [Acinetobacter sp. ANC 4633]
MSSDKIVITCDLRGYRILENAIKNNTLPLQACNYFDDGINGYVYFNTQRPNYDKDLLKWSVDVVLAFASSGNPNIEIIEF